MKMSQLTWVASLMLAVLALGCQPDSLLPAPDPVSPNPALSMQRGSISNQTINYASSTTVQLIDEAGQTQIQYCGTVPCSGTEPDWGMANLSDASGDLRVETTLAFGWFISRIDYFVGDEANINFNNGIPVPDASWSNVVLNPVVNFHAEDLPFPQLTGCFNYCVRLEILKVDFFSGVDQASVRNVYLYNPDWNNPNTPSQNSINGFVGNWCLLNGGGQ